MRRMLPAVAALAVAVFLGSCQDRNQPYGPSSMPLQFSEEAGNPVNSRIWIADRTWTTADGSVCTDYDNDTDFGVQCTKDGDTKTQSWALLDFNTDLYPVVEICLLTNGACDPEIRQTFTRVLGDVGEIIVDRPQTGRYFLDMTPGSTAGAWLQNQPLGTYRVIVGITFTGLDGVTPAPGWNISSDKVLGWYDFEFNARGADDKVRFRIRDGALCEGDGEECVETAFTPVELEANPIILDEDFDLAEGEGILGLKFPDGFADAVSELLDQQKINIIVERVRLNRENGERCISENLFASSTSNPDGIAAGEELEPCYRIRTEPYIDLTLLEDLKEPVRIGICLEPGAEDFSSLLQMLKYSTVKNRIDDIGDKDGLFSETNPFFTCPDDWDPNLAMALPEGTSRFALASSRLLGSMKSLVLPQPLYASARMFGSRDPGFGSLSDWSLFGVQATDGFKAEFLSPIGTADASDPANLGAVRETVNVRVCLNADYAGACPEVTTGTTAWAGTATWGTDHYQVNWNMPRTQTPGRYRVEFRLDSGLPYVKSDAIIVRGAEADAGLYTHNPGRTLPIKFYLTAPE
jgi:hypothetical protein